MEHGYLIPGAEFFMSQDPTGYSNLDPSLGSRRLPLP